MTGQVGECRECAASKDHAAAGQAVEPVRQIDSVGTSNKHDHGPGDESASEIPACSADRKDNGKTIRAILQSEVHRGGEEHSEQQLNGELLFDAQAVAVGAEFDPVVPRSQRAKGCHDTDAAQRVRTAEVSADQRCQNNRCGNEKPAHCGGRLLFGVQFVQLLGRTDDLFLEAALQPLDNDWAEHQRQ